MNEKEWGSAVQRCKEAAKAWRERGNDGRYLVAAIYLGDKVAAAIDALPDTLAQGLTERDGCEVAWLRTWVETGNDQGMASVGVATDRALAIIDRLCPPEPKHPDIPIGSKPVYGLDGNVMGYVL